jgi:hypothetical protein
MRFFQNLMKKAGTDSLTFGERTKNLNYLHRKEEIIE